MTRIAHAARTKLAERYGLTPTEVLVLRAVVEEDGGVRAMAAAVALSEATIKTYLHHLFRKTGSRRQVDPVKLVLTMAQRPAERRGYNTRSNLSSDPQQMEHRVSFDFANSSAASHRTTATDRARRAEMLGSVLALTALVLAVTATWANSRLPPQRRAEPFQMQSDLVAP
ncbi:hypothetical protein [Bradyrhizobium sp.]|uniref:hypothetical protein n=1 Tax=Bradyrhizobium sp. TaxID=376 RepID=UPI0023900D7C|nr:hypothetical protein [Bradyrhizobium sp.]MDE1936206.1 hypothetical protein [Bradyrhizobium sp.]